MIFSWIQVLDEIPSPLFPKGRLRRFFNSKPEERRAIFEEAAGVLKYKTRRKETESKLQQTQDNLDRLRTSSTSWIIKSSLLKAS